MILRAAGQHDVPALRDLIERAYRGESARAGWTHEADLLGGQRTDRAALARIVDDPGQRLLCLEDRAAPIGCVALERKSGALAYLGMLTVDPARQADGLGRRMLAEAERFARTRWNSRRIEMTVIEQRGELIGWYERRGYRRTGERRPFPAHDPRFGLPRRDDLAFAVLEKPI